MDTARSHTGVFVSCQAKSELGYEQSQRPSVSQSFVDSWLIQREREGLPSHNPEQIFVLGNSRLFDQLTDGIHSLLLLLSVLPSSLVVFLHHSLILKPIGVFRTGSASEKRTL